MLRRLDALRIGALTALCALTALPLPAQAAGLIEGDVYLVMKSGDTKKGAGRTVLLIPESESLQQARSGICTAMLQEYTRRTGPVRDSLLLLLAEARKRRDQLAITSYGAQMEQRIIILRDSVGLQLDSLYVAHQLRSTSSGMNAHYRFAGISPGRYTLYALWEIGSEQYTWLVPVTVSSDQPTVRDLDTENVLAERREAYPLFSWCRPFEETKE